MKMTETRLVASAFKRFEFEDDEMPTHNESYRANPVFVKAVTISRSTSERDPHVSWTGFTMKGDGTPSRQQVRGTIYPQKNSLPTWPTWVANLLGDVPFPVVTTEQM